MEKVTKFFDAVYTFFMIICKVFFTLMVVLTSYVVFNRFVMKGSLPWGEPIILMCMVYMCMLSASLAIRKDTHIRMTIVDLIAPDALVCVLRALAQVCIFAFSIFMIVYGWRFSMVAGRNVITGVGIKSMWLYLSVPLAGVSLCLMEIERVIRFFDRRKRGETLPQLEREADAIAQAEKNRLMQQKRDAAAAQEGA